MISKRRQFDMRKKKGELKLLHDGVVEILSGGEDIEKDFSAIEHTKDGNKVKLKNAVTFQDSLSEDPARREMFKEMTKFFSHLTKLGYVFK